MDGQMNIFDFMDTPEPKPDPRPDACVREYLRYGAHTLIPEVAERVKKYLDKYGVPTYIKWDKQSLPCSNCEHYDGLQCIGGGGRYHYEYGYKICYLFHQSIEQRTQSTAVPFTPAEEYFKATGKTDYWQASQGKPYRFWEQEPICQYSGHSCNKKNLWDVADALDDTQCPHVCCRLCSTKGCGARCNGSKEPTQGASWRKYFDETGFGWLPLSIKPSDVGISDKARIYIHGRYKNHRGNELVSECRAILIDDEIVPIDVTIDIPSPDWFEWSFQDHKEITRKLYREEPFVPNRTFYRICIVDFTIGNTVYWRPVYNTYGDTLEFYDREHAVHFIGQHPEAVGYHNYEIRPRTYEQWLLDENQQNYGRPGNEWDGFKMEVDGNYDRRVDNEYS